MEGAGILGKLSREEKKLSPMTKSEDLVRRLASVSAGVPYELVWEGFADTRSNPGPDVVREFLGRVGMEEPGRKLADKIGMSQGSSDVIHVSFMKLRNECAHTGTAVNVPTTVEIAGYCDFIEKVAEGIDAILTTHLTTAPFVPSGPATAPVPVAAPTAAGGGTIVPAARTASLATPPGNPALTTKSVSTPLQVTMASPINKPASLWSRMIQRVKEWFR